MTPLLAATYYSKENVVDLLLAKMANTEAKDTVCYCSIVWRPITIYSIKKDRGRTPLIWAADYGAENIVQMLLKAKADINATDKVFIAIAEFLIFIL